MMKKKIVPVMLLLALIFAIIPLTSVSASAYSKSITGQGRLAIHIDAQSDGPPEHGPVLWYQYHVKNSAGVTVFSSSIGGPSTGSLNNLPYDTYTLYVTPNAWTYVSAIYLQFI
ncbi:hypothetical protein [Paenibacillus sp. GSMTC-2017]|uniref:hypothetical protein n=1 Tax=Paenibacillus sp. GSMTC-2017 TaxID=2794350 RepID=UPI001E538C6A|nr:hypothetical protein [Paenibacillus sp. GSMTC-2017]